ncbi:MAG: bifunctional folylpolyglutamate synthase/dihydrofolate synthase [Sphingomonadaceae bacterium]
MADHARSDDPAVQAQLDRFAQLSPGRDILGLERITQLLARVGNPHEHLPPVFHVAGTNGKGSTCAFLRAAVEAAGLTAHVYTSPHLCRFNERIRIGGSLIEDSALAPLLSEVLDAACDLGVSFFEATTAAAFLAFARKRADVAIIEVGLGGRLDATNVIAGPAICGIAQLGIDHQAFLGDNAVDIAGEKAGIAKAGVPLITMKYDAPITQRIAQIADAAGAPMRARGSEWDAAPYQQKLHYRDAGGTLSLPLPSLPGMHQAQNAALAIAMLRHQSAVNISDAALKAAMGWALWPARIQRMARGPLNPDDRDIWIDGCHNEPAAVAIATHFRSIVAPGAPFHIIVGILANKDAAGLIRQFKGLATHMTALPVHDHAHHVPEALAAMGDALGIVSGSAASLSEAVPKHADIPTLIIGSLYLAGEALRANQQMPD